MVAPAQPLVLTVDKPAHGGRMIARHEGRIVLVRGAIPGERVVAVLERVEKRLAFADTVEVVEPSPDRRDGLPDPRCGGCILSHVAYPRQLRIKSEIVADAFARLGRMPLETAVPVAGSPERGYRMRARFHVRAGSVGFYREGTHELCDPAATGQLADGSLPAIEAAMAALGTNRQDARAVELSENIDGTMRVAAIELARAPSGSVQGDLERALGARLTGCTVWWPGARPVTAGVPVVSDGVAGLTGGRAPGGSLSRHAESFFQSNRYLVGDLVTSVLDAVSPAGDVIDLYAGVGLFSIALAGTGRTGITAVEGDRSSGADLRRNATPYGEAVRVVLRSVEDYLESRRPGRPPGAIIVDPPRTGLSPHALAGLTRFGPETIVYVSCDPATMARDARRLADGGYALESLRGFDLFPNTAHVELLSVFRAERAASIA